MQSGVCYLFLQIFKLKLFLFLISLPVLLTLETWITDSLVSVLSTTLHETIY